jgi:hypothetical protein
MRVLLSGWRLAPKESPTAHALLAEVTVTPFRKLSRAPGLGLVARAHLRPFQCRMRVWLRAEFPEVPTAHALTAEVAPMRARRRAR